MFPRLIRRQGFQKCLQIFHIFTGSKVGKYGVPYYRLNESNFSTLLILYKTNFLITMKRHQKD